MPLLWNDSVESQKKLHIFSNWIHFNLYFSFVFPALADSPIRNFQNITTKRFSTHNFVHVGFFSQFDMFSRRSHNVYWYQTSHFAQYLYQNCVFVTFLTAPKCVVTHNADDYWDSMYWTRINFVHIFVTCFFLKMSMIYFCLINSFHIAKPFNFLDHR